MSATPVCVFLFQHLGPYNDEHHHQCNLNMAIGSFFPVWNKVHTGMNHNQYYTHTLLKCYTAAGSCMGKIDDIALNIVCFNQRSLWAPNKRCFKQRDLERVSE